MSQRAAYICEKVFFIKVPQRAAIDYIFSLVPIGIMHRFYGQKLEKMGVNFFFWEGGGGGAERRERMCPKEHQNTLLSQCKSNDWFLYEMQHWTEMTE